MMNLLHEIQEVLSEEELIAAAKNKRQEKFLLLLRNIAVGIAALLFFVSICPGATKNALIRGVAYFFGSIAYFSELFLLTECFRKRVPHTEMFMVYCFGPTYILMGISYLVEHFEHYVH